MLRIICWPTEGLSGHCSLLQTWTSVPVTGKLCKRFAGENVCYEPVTDLLYHPVQH